MTRKRVLVILAGAVTVVALVVLGLQLAASFAPASTDLGPGVTVEQPARPTQSPSGAPGATDSPTVPVAPGDSSGQPTAQETGNGR